MSELSRTSSSFLLACRGSVTYAATSRKVGAVRRLFEKQDEHFLASGERNILPIGLLTVLASETKAFLDPSEENEQDECSFLCGW